ncbi:MAG: aminodeoxychorismate synthase component I [Tannerellaceae bacterium]|jgi:para-aminobenzoate synthetase|nr:aminodeoxychorismate synthase component I [Tannerellaceae bacterium]
MWEIPDYSIVPRKVNYNTMVNPQKVQVAARKVPIFYDTERVFYHLFANEAYAFWLDSSRVDSKLSRFSFMGTNDGPMTKTIYYDMKNKQIQCLDANGKTEINESIFEYLDHELLKMNQQSPELPFDFNGGFVGYLGYELKADCGTQPFHNSSQPDAIFIFADRIIAFDHEERCIYLVSIVPIDKKELANDWFGTVENKLKNISELPPLVIEDIESVPSLNIKLSQKYSKYIDTIKECQKYIFNGETYEICLTNKICVQEQFDPFLTYRILRSINPAPYSAFFKFPEFSILCSSPERFLKIDKNRIVEAKPIKGTIARGTDIEEDIRLAEYLRTNEKERAENLMIVDLLRNDLGLVCDVGSVHVPNLMSVESYETVHQLVTTIRGSLRNDLTCIDCIKAAFPGGSMTGAPKLRTMKFIDELETEARGVYSGAIGFMGINGTIDLNIVIRTIIMSPEEATIGAGGAITILSDPNQEFEEMALKGEALVKALIISRYGKCDQIQLEHILRENPAS